MRRAVQTRDGVGAFLHRQQRIHADQEHAAAAPDGKACLENTGIVQSPRQPVERPIQTGGNRIPEDQEIGR